MRIARRISKRWPESASSSISSSTMALSPSIDFRRSTGVVAMKILPAGEMAITAYSAVASVRR